MERLETELSYITKYECGDYKSNRVFDFLAINYMNEGCKYCQFRDDTMCLMGHPTFVVIVNVNDIYRSFYRMKRVVQAALDK